MWGGSREGSERVEEDWTLTREQTTPTETGIPTLLSGGGGGERGFLSFFFFYLFSSSLFFQSVNAPK